MDTRPGLTRLSCSVGRPGNSIMFDPTGTGDNWEKSIVVYWGGLTGYTCMLEIARRCLKPSVWVTAAKELL